MRTEIGLLTALALCGFAASAQGQGAAVGGALGAPAQPKVTAPAAAPTVRAGDGGGPTAVNDPQALAAAIESCDMTQTLALGGTAKDAARILKAKGQGSANMDPNTAVWVRNGPDSFALAFQTTSPPGARGFFMAGGFPGFTPNIASLPTADEAYGGPPPPPAGPSPLVTELGKSVMGGMSATEAATRYVAANPPAAGRVTDPAQAQFARSVRAPGVVLIIPSFIAGGGLATAQIILPGTESYPGLASMLAESEGGRPALRRPANIPEAPPPPTRC